MGTLSTIQKLSQLVSRATKSTRFCVKGSLPEVDPGLEVEGVRKFKFPLSPRSGKLLVAAGTVAPFGKGTKTLVDTKVRNAFELNPSQFTLSNPRWQDAIAEATRQVAEQLGLPSEGLEARLYKLLVYQKGGFFVPHRDSEKHKGRFPASTVTSAPGWKRRASRTPWYARKPTVPSSRPWRRIARTASY